MHFLAVACVHTVWVTLLVLHVWYCCCCMCNFAAVVCVILLLHAWYCYCIAFRWRLAHNFLLLLKFFITDALDYEANLIAFVTAFPSDESLSISLLLTSYIICCCVCVTAAALACVTLPPWYCCCRLRDITAACMILTCMRDTAIALHFVED